MFFILETKCKFFFWFSFFQVFLSTMSKQVVISNIRKTQTKMMIIWILQILLMMALVMKVYISLSLPPSVFLCLLIGLFLQNFVILVNRYSGRWNN